MLVKVNSYGAKNFYKELGLSQHFTFRGLLRRWERQYPILFKWTKFSIIYTLLLFTPMLFIPGTILPFQKSLKLFVVARYIPILM